PPPAMITRTSAPEAIGGDPRALGQRRELGPADLRVDLLGGGLRGEAAVVADHHVLPANEFRVLDGELGDQLGVLDPVRAVAQHAGDDHLALGGLTSSNAWEAWMGR